MKNFSYEIGKVEQTLGKHREHRFIIVKEENKLIYYAMARTEGGEPHHDDIARRYGYFFFEDKCVGGGVAEFSELPSEKNILFFYGTSKSCGGAVPWEIMLNFEDLLLETYKKIDPSIEYVKILTEDSNEFLDKWLERFGKV